MAKSDTKWKSRPAPVTCHKKENKVNYELGLVFVMRLETLEIFKIYAFSCYPKM
jgi:hypothetical protein